MVKILIDTCVWLDLAKDHRQQSLINVIDELIEQKKLQLILPKLVVEEFDRNKDRIIEETRKSVSGMIKNVREVINAFGDDGEKESVLNYLTNIDYKKPIIGEYSAIGTTNWIGLMFESTPKIEVSDAQKLRAFQRSTEKLAPFHNGKNNSNDALLLEVFLDQVQSSKLKSERFIFVTHNTKEFSDPIGNKNNPHPDLAMYFDGTKSKYFINLSEALKNVSPKLVPHLIEERSMFDRNPRFLSEILEAESEMVDRVWYNRHKFREWQIAKGKIKIIPDKDFSIKTSQSTITKSIWTGALASAKKMEKKRGKKNLGPYSDFEWGMVNGKLSALRWMLGEDWDELYT